MKTKADGISILVSMGASLIVLSLAFATLSSIARSAEQASNIQRSTQLFFASESGAEAAFFHHNARGAGLLFDGVDDAVSDSVEDRDEVATEIYHNAIDATTNWSLQGRTTHIDNAIDQNSIIVDILKEGQSFRVPLKWDPASNPTANVPTGPSDYDHPDRASNDEIEIRFFRTPNDMPASDALTEFEERYGFESDAFDALDPAGGNFDFGDSGDDEILIDWSLTRKNDVQGIQTFIPTENQDCGGYVSGAGAGYICEQDIRNNPNNIIINTFDAVPGKVLPGAIDTNLDLFWDCVTGADDSARLGETCSDYQLTIRPLLPYEDTDSADQIPGLPFQVKLDTGPRPTKPFPLNYYTVISDVSLEDFSQRIEIEIPERTSIGAFDYVIFD